MKLKRFTIQLVAAGLIAVPLMAQAAGLGKLSVTSALGQPLAAEIELFAANKAELENLSATLAAEQAYRDARIDFAPVLSSLRFTVEKRPNGKAVLKVTTPRPVNDPFIDMLVELSWAAGRLVREYTMLLDPPGTAVAQTVSPVVVESAPAAAAPKSAPPEPAAAYGLPEGEDDLNAEAVSEPAAEPAPEKAEQPEADAQPAASAEATPEIETAAVPASEPAPEPAATSEAATGPTDNLAAEPTREAEPADKPVAAAEPVESERAATAETPAAAAASVDAGAKGDGQVKVKRGDTLSEIAQRVRPQSVSLEQTLIGLYRENPDAFVGNVNRLKAGKTLKLPSTEQIASIPQQDAVREVKLQAADWRAYRQKLAAEVAASPDTGSESSQASSGKITPKVEDRAEAAVDEKQDVLKLSKATPAAGAAKTEQEPAVQTQDEDATAREKSLQEAGQRAALLEKQIEDMQKLAELKGDAQADAAAPAAETDAEATGDTPAATPASAEADPLMPVAVEAPQAAPEPADNWYDPVLADPLYWGGGVAALGLGGLLWWMMAGGRRQKKSTELEDSLIAGGTLNPAHGGGAASGGSVNTGDSSFLTDFSQAGLGAIDTHDVDPIAEAEVYMAYGRDAQAEEILKEAIGKTPERHEIRVKLLEIYAARRNAAAFGSAAGELYAALGGKPSPLWDKVCDMGRNVDPTNPLYGSATPAAPVFAAAATVAATAGVSGGAVSFADELVVPKSLAAKPAAPVAAAAPQAVAKQPAPAPEPVFEFANEIAALDFDFDAAPKQTDAKPAAQKAAPSLDINLDTEGLKFELPDLDVPAPKSTAGDFDFGEVESNSGGGYDFSGFDLDLGAGAGDDLDEVGTKLDLARAYVEMGDKEGAREILNEVLAEGNDRQKADAKGIMSSLG